MPLFVEPPVRRWTALRAGLLFALLLPALGAAPTGKAKGKSKSKAGRVPELAERLRTPAQRQAAVLVSTGQWRQATRVARSMLAEDPRDPEGHALMAVVCAHYGNYPCAAEHLEPARAASSLGLMRAGVEADLALYSGDLDLAVELQDALGVARLDRTREVGATVKLARNLRLAGRLDEAEDVLAEALGEVPDSVVLHAAMGEVAAARGDLEVATGWLWLGARQGPPSSTWYTSAQGVALMAGDPELALSYSDEARRYAPRAVWFAGLRAEALVRAGRADEALTLLEIKTWQFDGELWHPDLLGPYAMALLDLGYYTEAAAAARRLAAHHTGYPPADRALGWIEARLAAQPPR